MVEKRKERIWLGLPKGQIAVAMVESPTQMLMVCFEKNRVGWMEDLVTKYKESDGIVVDWYTVVFEAVKACITFSTEICLEGKVAHCAPMSRFSRCGHVFKDCPF